MSERKGCLAAIFGLFGFPLGRRHTEPVDLVEADEHIDPTQPLSFRLRDDFLSPAELSFYRVLASTLRDQAVICCKVNLADLFYFYVAKPNENQGLKNKIDRPHAVVSGLLTEPRPVTAGLPIARHVSTQETYGRTNDSVGRPAITSASTWTYWCAIPRPCNPAAASNSTTPATPVAALTTAIRSSLLYSPPPLYRQLTCLPKLTAASCLKTVHLPEPAPQEHPSPDAKVRSTPPRLRWRRR